MGSPSRHDTLPNLRRPEAPDQVPVLATAPYGTAIPTDGLPMAGASPATGSLAVSPRLDRPRASRRRRQFPGYGVDSVREVCPSRSGKPKVTALQVHLWIRTHTTVHVANRSRCSMAPAVGMSRPTVSNIQNIQHIRKPHSPRPDGPTMPRLPTAAALAEKLNEIVPLHLTLPWPHVWLRNLPHVVSNKSMKCTRIFVHSTENAMSINADLNGHQEKDVIIACLAQWARSSSLGHRIYVNLERESFLPREGRIGLLTVFSQSTSCDANTLRDRYVAACRWSLRGGSIRGNVRPTRIGRAVARDRLVSYLWRRYRKSVFVTLANVRRFVDRIASQGVLYPEERHLLMSEYPVWVTWDDVDPARGAPFQFGPSKQADCARANLGLVSRRPREPRTLLLLVYKNQDIELMRPTVADAADHAYFEPSLCSDYGRTVPWPKEIEPAACEVKPRPEALHEPVSFSLLEVCESWD